MAIVDWVSIECWKLQNNSNELSKWTNKIGYKQECLVGVFTKPCQVKVFDVYDCILIDELNSIAR